MTRFTGPQHGHVVGATRASDTACILETRVRPTLGLPPAPRRRDAFPLLVAAATLAVVALYFARLGSVPPGPYLDEASIGYNAWTVAHFGVDQYGNHVPLFFVDFGDYKGPLATYLTVPFAWFFGTTLGAVRAPSVLAGIATALVAGALAYRLSRSRGVALIALLFTALQPWVFLQSHTMMEGNVLLLLGVLLACWFVAEATARQHADRWWSAAGVALGAAVFAYSLGRLLTLLLALAVVATCHRFGRRAMLRFLFPIGAAYAVLLGATLANPDVLLARASVVSVFSDHPTLLAAAGRFLANYLSYFNPSFLVISGDGNLRQTTGFGGVIVAATLPLMIAGLVRLVMRLREPYSRFIVLGLLVSPIPAALTLVAPHALRGAGMLAFLIVLMIEGLAWARELIGSRRALAVTL
ncbi:MAG: phospholipid carrier-dependent glycosyltransferase, partial [Candidatus Dormibacteraeota bacterium]|nr:phospholipid carrier-dependent glycosyltransferase [Candidatus Dormibacteraeota bacterium]